MKRARVPYQCPEDGCSFSCDDRRAYIDHMTEHEVSTELRVLQQKVCAIHTVNGEIVARLQELIPANTTVSVSHIVEPGEDLVDYPSSLQPAGSVPIGELAAKYQLANGFDCLARVEGIQPKKWTVAAFEDCISMHLLMRDSIHILKGHRLNCDCIDRFAAVQGDLERLQVALGECEEVFTNFPRYAQALVTEWNELESRRRCLIKQQSSISKIFSLDSLTLESLTTHDNVENIPPGGMATKIVLKSPPKDEWNVFVGTLPVSTAVFHLKGFFGGRVFVGMAPTRDFPLNVHSAVRSGAFYEICNEEMAKYPMRRSYLPQDSPIIVKRSDGKFTFYYAAKKDISDETRWEKLGSMYNGCKGVVYPAVYVSSFTSSGGQYASIELLVDACKK